MAGAITKVADPRALRAGRDTGIARLPALPRVSSGNAQVDDWMNRVNERFEVREGARGNDAERVVTQRELKAVLGDQQAIRRQVDAISNAVAGTADALTPQEAVTRFQDNIRQLQLYKDLMKSLNDPSRFDNLRVEIRQALLRSLTDEARKLGASIEQTQKKIQDANLSLAMQVNQITAAVDDAASGVRQTQFATDELGRAQAGIVTQLQASLGNYYQDGTEGRASLEEEMLVTADRIEGLSSQYTLKVQAGGALAGFGLSATEKNGVPDSAFIVVANKFALVRPDYSGGLTNMPDSSAIPFGLDSNGIYMNSAVYLSGTMRIQGGTRTLAQGLRGSLQVNAATTGAWSDAVASAKIWTALGNTGSPPNGNHLVIGDMVTIGSITRYWNGTAWTNPGMVITGDLLVDGTIAAAKINTNGLTIKDASGNVILGAGTPLSANWINSLPSSKVTGLGSLATQNSVSTSQVSGLGSLATQNAAQIGSTVQFPDGSTMNTSDFVNKLQRIGSGNIGTFMDGAAITNAYIGNAAVGTLQVQGQAITGMAYGSNGGGTQGVGGSIPTGTALLSMPSGSSGVFISATMVLWTDYININQGEQGHASTVSVSIWRNGSAIATNATSIGSMTDFVTITAFDGSPANGNNTYYATATMQGDSSNSGYSLHMGGNSIIATGAKR